MVERRLSIPTTQNALHQCWNNVVLFAYGPNEESRMGRTRGWYERVSGRRPQGRVIPRVRWNVLKRLVQKT